MGLYWRDYAMGRFGFFVSGRLKKGAEMDESGEKSVSIAALERKAKKCPHSCCTLHKKSDSDRNKDCTKVVFDGGDRASKVMFVGEAPGKHEDEQGKPFVGDAGDRLNELIRENLAEWTRDSIYITNLVKCRPAGDDDPRSLEIKTCFGFLEEQIRAICPKVIVAVGRFAGSWLAYRKTTGKLKDMRAAKRVADELKYKDPEAGDKRLREGIPLLVVRHPSAFRFQKKDKLEKEIEEDWGTIHKKLRKLR